MINLKNLYLNNNEIEQIDFGKTSNLENLFLSANQIRKLRVKHLKKLEDLRCNNNKLLNLDVRGLTNLKNLDCSGNFFININDFLYARWMHTLKLGNNPNLVSIDCAELDLDGYNDLIQFPPLPNLENLTLRQNGNDQTIFKKTIVIRSPKLFKLSFNKQVGGL